ncbi:MAG: HDIG domain-containing metalloprotein [Calditrichota bacterium]
MNTFQKNRLAFKALLNETELLGMPLNRLLVRFACAASLILMIAWLLPSQRPFEYSNLVVGSIAPEEIIAPFKFAIRKSDETIRDEREAVMLAVPPLFDRVEDVPNVQSLTLKQFFDDVERFFKENNRKPDDSVAASDTVKTVVDSFLETMNLKYNQNMTIQQLVWLHEVNEKKRLRTLSRRLDENFKNVYKTGVLDRAKSDIPEKLLVVAKKGIEEPVQPDEVLEPQQAYRLIEENLRKRFGVDAVELKPVIYLAETFLQPNLVYNEAVTIERKEQAEHDVPLTRGFVEQDERIIDNHEVVTESVYRKLQSLALALEERANQQEGIKKVLFNLGKFFFALLLVVLTAMYIYLYRNKIYAEDHLLIMITVILLFQLVAAALILRIPDWSHLSIPLVMAPMLLAMLLDFGVAFICTVFLSVVLGATIGNDFSFTTLALVVGSVAAFSVQKIRNRGHMVRAIVFIMLAYFAVDMIFGLLHSDSPEKIVSDFGKFILPNAILAPTVVFFLNGIFERYFDVTTDITLLELSDLNHELMKDLSVKAPGTFHHSVVVSNLAEAAAKAIGANALLTRVGCYFHDIGKMQKPEYFVENQLPGANKHDNLSPHMSCLVLINHVKAGLDMAEKHGLPLVVKQFIAEHHGTSLISYFYHKALENGDSKEINESDFRYPGPKPRSKETAISMVADTVEAASRTLNNPTPQRIRNMVDTLVEQKIKEGQLDDCNLTLNEITQIKEAFHPILTGIHHSRIEYPGEIVADEKSREKSPAREKNGSRSASKTPEKKVEISGKEEA